MKIKSFSSRSRMENRPSFFKVVCNPQAACLRIPEEFTEKEGQELPNNIHLKAPNGSFWKIELIHSNGDTWLQQGWPEFRDYYNIKLGYWLLFEYDGDALFHVQIYDMTTTEIEYPFDTDGEEIESESEEDSGGSGIDMSWRFSKQLKKYHAFKLVLPLDFARGTGLTDVKKIMVRNMEGEKWSVNVKKPQDGRYALGRGWNKFLIENEVTVGSTLSLDFIRSAPENVIQVRVVKMRKTKRKLFKYVKLKGTNFQIVAPHEVRGRGRPRLSANK